MESKERMRMFIKKVFPYLVKLLGGRVSGKIYDKLNLKEL